ISFIWSYVRISKTVGKKSRPSAAAIFSIFSCSLTRYCGSAVFSANSLIKQGYPKNRPGGAFSASGWQGPEADLMEPFREPRTHKVGRYPSTPTCGVGLWGRVGRSPDMRGPDVKGRPRCVFFRCRVPRVAVSVADSTLSDVRPNDRCRHHV